MNKKMLLIVITVAVLMVAPAFASSGCRNGHFVGAYVSSSNTPIDVFGDGTVIHNFVFQLNLHSDGTADQYWTGLPDYIMTLGTGSPWIGSWTCRNDGKLVVTMLFAGYNPVAANPPNNVHNDIKLLRHTRTTYLFSVDDDNTLTRIESRSRVYAPADDASIATGGTLLPINTDDTTQYKRLSASDADLLAP